MNICYLFEDNSICAVSKCLALNNFGVDVVFSNGNLNLVKKLKTEIDTRVDTLIIVFVDLVPDNKRTEEAYNRVISFISNEYIRIKNKGNKVLVVPNICMEYTILKSIESLKCLKLAECLADIWKGIAEYNIDRERYMEIRDRNNIPNLEKMCKFILNNNLYNKCTKMRKLKRKVR